MEIIKCDPSHIDALTELYDRITLNLERTVNYPKWTNGVYPARESVTKAVSDGVQYMCLDGGRAVGAFILNRDPQGDYSSGDWTAALCDGDYYVIHTLASDPALSRRGIGRFMVDFCVQTARASGLRGIRLDVVPDNLPARRLYEKCGFRFAGERDLGRGIKEIPEFALYELNF